VSVTSDVSTIQNLVQETNTLQPLNINKLTKRQRKIRYKDVVCAFDIETTVVGEDSVMYIWQFQYGLNTTIIGRTWEQFLLLCDYIKQSIGNNHLVVYVHNLSYEFQFLAGIYNFEPEEVFAIKTRKILKCTMFDCMEFRCSYLHSNMSLDKFTQSVGTTTQKAVGFLDYDKPHYYFTELTKDEITYAINDVISLVEAIYIEMERDNDDLYTIPLTSTGYVRRDCKTAMKASMFDVKSILPNFEVYEMLHKAFRGGNTHANRYYTGIILENVHSIDRKSSYPETQCNLEFPVTRFQFIDPDLSVSELVRLRSRGKAFIMKITFMEIELRNIYWGCPYLSRDKSEEIIDGIYDNGRVIQAKQLTTYITDIDFEIINKEYQFTSFCINRIATSDYGTLPEELTNVIKNYFTVKTDLDGVEEYYYYYMKAKNKLNSVYGMTAQDPVKISVVFENGEYHLSDVSRETLLKENERSAFLPYQWGVWCTAHARMELEHGIDMCYAEDSEAEFIYTDTDSVKYIGTLDKALDRYNKEKIALSSKYGSTAKDRQGNQYYMGVYEREGDYKQFLTFGAKKYAYVDMKDKLHITIAGVPKIKGAEELEKAGGLTALEAGIKNETDGFIFHAGKLEAKYNDDSDYTITIDGYPVHVTRNVLLRPCTYNLALTPEYSEIVRSAQEYAYAKKKLNFNLY
jgi:hypothetical protein